MDQHEQTEVMPGRLARWAMRVERAWSWCVSRVRAGCRCAAEPLRPWRPAVLVDAPRGRSRRLRRMVRQATREQFRALGVRHPEHLLIVVQELVHEEQPLASLLRVYEDDEQHRRHVLFVALSVDGEAMSDGAVLSVLRQQLNVVVGDALGGIAFTHEVHSARRRSKAAVTPIRPTNDPTSAPPWDEEAPFPDDQDMPAPGAVPAAAGG